MVERYVMVKLREDLAHPAGRAEVAAHSRAALAAVPGVVAVRAAHPADEATAHGWDLSIVVSFASLSDVEPYRVHPLHLEYVERYLGPRMTFKKVWNFELPD